MTLPRPGDRGFSLVELLVVMVIAGILAVVSVTMLGNRKAEAVRSMLDEIEGALGNARQLSVATGRDVALDVWGSWSSADTFIMAYGDAALSDPQIQTAAGDLLLSQAVPNDTYSKTVAVPFHFLPSDAIQTRTRLVQAESTDWAIVAGATSSGATNTAITANSPFDAAGVMHTLVKDQSALDTNNLFKQSSLLPYRTLISGNSQRFSSTFIIEIVGTSSAGPMPGGPMGLIVVLANGAEIFKFYNPGVLEGNGQWRRI
jgi:prepilin-type N-terminal cleavage/methylation domain-containing protein